MLRSIIVVVLTTFIFSLSPASAGEVPSFDEKRFFCKEETLGALLAPKIETAAAKQFRTAIRQTARKTGVNFCGKFTFVRVGFTGPFQVNFIVDRETGKVFEAPSSEAEVKFVEDSSLLVVNAEVNEIAEYLPGDTLPTIQYYHWNGKKFVLLFEEKVVRPIS